MRKKAERAAVLLQPKQIIVFVKEKKTANKDIIL
jgi:hypothetical protein